MTVPMTPSAPPPVGSDAARAESVSKIYGSEDTQVVALDDITVAFEAGRFTAIMGPSGSGKSTLMHVCAGLDTPTSGRAFVGETDLTALDDDSLTRLRRDQVGFIFQAFNLVPTLTALENITLPLDIAGRKADPEWLDRLIDTVGLRDRLASRPNQLSGGQQQRVAAARALVTKPKIIFADEPTGNLDSRAGVEVLTFLRNSAEIDGQTVVMVTHDPTAASFSHRVLFLADGTIVDTMDAPTAELVLERMKGFDAKGRRS